MNEEQRIHAIPQLNNWRRTDPTVAEMCMCVMRAHQQPSVGHLARFLPETFDELFEEAQAMTENHI
jgi:hypothetical protein